jgi:diguanylate cyclase (GGDEF)-like protein
MARSIRVAPEHIEKVQLALRQGVYPSQSALASDVGLTRPTISNFFNGKPVDYLNFIEICQRLDLDWRAIAARGVKDDESPPLDEDAAFQVSIAPIPQVPQPENQNEIDILVVDDRPDNIRLLSTMLLDQGFKVRKAVSGEMALTAVDTLLPNLILLDISMPLMDGYEVCQRLKLSERTREIPVIFISALDEPIDKVKAFTYGGADYITKPFQLEEVLARIEHQLTICRLKRQMQWQNRLLQEEIKQRLEVDRAVQEQNILLQKEVQNRLKIEKLLQEQNVRLQQEIQSRQLVEKTLQERNIRLQSEIQDRTQIEEALKKANQQLLFLAEQASMDALTQIANRRGFDQYLDQEWQRLFKEELPLSLILCDVDHFKRYNDIEGHQKGDECLQAIAQSINDVVQTSEGLVARYGGDELAVILPGVHIEQAMQVADSIRLSVLNLNIIHPDASSFEYVTVSLGVASVIPTSESSPENLISVTDQALYRAKENGKNVVST